MSMKEFDAKQFLLEKGERVGLGVAVTLMVLMLILSLFMPGGGFFSDSPKKMQVALKQGTDRLDNDLRTKMPTAKDLPEQREGRLIELDTRPLNPDSYAPKGSFFEPRMKENPNRRPPIIYPVEEAVVEIARVPIDTYMFSSDFKKIWVLVDRESGNRSSAPAAGQGNFNPFSRMGQMPGAGSMPMMGGPGGGMRGGGMSGMGGMMQQMMQMRQGGGNQAARNLQAANDTQEYDARLIPVDNWNPQERTAHQVRPLRMAIIAGSFPYKNQLKEHQTKLRKASIDEVLNEEVDTSDGKKKDKAFRFLGVEVQRKEVDANGKDLTDWTSLRLAEIYQAWLKYTYYPFQPEDPKLEQVRFPGLAMPLLREFHASQTTSAPGGVPGMNMMMQMMQGKMQPGAMQPTKTAAEEASPKSEHYPDVVKNLPKIQATLDTLAKLNDAQVKIARPKFTPATLLDAFNPDASVPNDNQQPLPTTDAKGGANAGEEYIPEYVLARAVDLEIQPGKSYRYRLRIKMANPNYKRSDVASPDYKEKEALESKQWYEIPNIVRVPSETNYYVVNEKEGKSQLELRQIPVESAQARLWKENPRPDQVVMQFQRWVDMTARSRRDSEQVPVGEWAVADRVFVSRGEYVGRKVNVDIPIWVYTRNSFILPTEEQKTRANRRPSTGIDVEFGTENPDDNLILIDFEGGKVNGPGTSKIVDTSVIEVLMFSPDGKLLARNSGKDTNNDERKKVREDVMKRILDVRIGKKE